MAESDVPGLTELAATPAAGDLFHVVDVSDTSAAPDGTDKKITATNLIGAATAALASHEADTTSIHGIADTSVLETTTGAQTKVDTHVNDTSAAHAASAISADSTTLVGTGTTVQAVFEELDNAIVAAEAATAAHLADTSDAHDASAVSADSTTLVGTGTDVQAVLEELDNSVATAVQQDVGYVQYESSYSTGTVTMTDQASAVQLFGQNSGMVHPENLTNMRQVRLFIRCSTGSASANSPRIKVMYKTGAWSATIGDFADIGTGPSEVACSLTTATGVLSAWTDLIAAAKAEVWVCVAQVGGDASADPAVNRVVVQYRD